MGVDNHGFTVKEAENRESCETRQKGGRGEATR
jgi:hypothetical protein